MANLKDTALSYEKKKTGNIAELDEVPVNIDVFEKTGTKSDGTDFSYQAINIDGNEYKVPISVLAALKEFLEEIPLLQTFKVKKSGTGMDTNYTVIPLKVESTTEEEHISDVMD